MKDHNDLIDEVHEFWFGPSPYERRVIWFEKHPDFDAEIRTRFGETWTQASSGAFDHFAETARGRLVLLVLLDQFSRNLYRGNALAFSNDAKALELANVGICEGHDMEVTRYERIFMYLPFEHSEVLADQKRFIELPDYPVRSAGFGRMAARILRGCGAIIMVARASRTRFSRNSKRRL